MLSTNVCKSFLATCDLSATSINSFKDNLPSDFNFNRIKELFKSELEARKPGKDYPKNIYNKDFPNGKEYTSEVDGPTKLDVEIKSAFSTALLVSCN